MFFGAEDAEGAFLSIGRTHAHYNLACSMFDASAARGERAGCHARDVALKAAS